MDESTPLSTVVIFGLLPAAVLVYYIVLFLRRGREYRFPHRRYLRDPEQIELTPAQVGYIWRKGHVSGHEINATLLDLADRGVLEIADATDHHDATFTLTDDGPAELLEHEKAIITMLFGRSRRRRTAILSDISAAGGPGSSLVEFKLALVHWAEAESVFEAESFAARTRGVCAGGVMVALSLAAALAADYGALFIVGLPLGLAMIVASEAMLRESVPAARIRAQAEALRLYLHDFGRLQEKPPGGVVMWSRYLVFAELFGMADQVRHELLRYVDRGSLQFGSLTWTLDTIAWAPPLPVSEPRTRYDDGGGGGGGEDRVIDLDDIDVAEGVPPSASRSQP